MLFSKVIFSIFLNVFFFKRTDIYESFVRRAATYAFVLFNRSKLFIP